MRKKKSVPRMRPLSLDTGEGMWVKQDLYLSCCGCGLRHHVTIDKQVGERGGRAEVVANDIWLLLKFYTDPAGTDVIRHERKIKVVSTRKKKK